MWWTMIDPGADLPAAGWAEGCVVLSMALAASFWRYFWMAKAYLTQTR